LLGLFVRQAFKPGFKQVGRRGNRSAVRKVDTSRAHRITNGLAEICDWRARTLLEDVTVGYVKPNLKITKM